MATYRVNYFIKRNGREYTASHIAEGRTAAEAIANTRDYTEKRHLPHPFRPKAVKLSSFELSRVCWKSDTITANYVHNNAEDLLDLTGMAPTKLAEVATYCKTNENPYADELIRRAGCKQAPDESRGALLRRAAKAFGILIF